MSRTQNPTHAHNAYTYTHVHGDRDITPRKIPPGRLYPGRLPPEHSPPSKPGFAKYAVDANLFPLESSNLTRAKRATNRKNIRFFRGETFLGGIYRGGTFRGGDCLGCVTMKDMQPPPYSEVYPSKSDCEWCAMF